MGGGVGDFLLGGSQQKQKSTSQSSSQQSAQNSNVNASQSNSSNQSGSANRAYDPLSAALTPSLGYVSDAGNMIGALLGLPQSSFSYQAPVPSVLPGGVGGGGGGGRRSRGAMPDLISALFAKYSAGAPPAAVATPPTALPPPPVPPVGSSKIVGGGGGGLQTSPFHMEARAGGGPVNAGQPYLVGEKRPEVFVPNQDGHIVPDVSMMGTMFGHPRRDPRVRPTPTPVTPTAPAAYTPPSPVYNNPVPNPTNAVNTFANSAGMNFILDQGQKAISGASAGNGTFNSGATGKALVQYGQGLGQQYLKDYMDNLFNYAKLGLGSASALSGSGGVSQGAGTGSSSSFGYGQGSSQGSSSSTGTGTSTGHTKNGLIPDLTNASAAYASGGGKF